MSLHSLLSVTIGVPNVGETAAYYADFGLTPADDGWFSTADAGQQLRLLPSPVRRLLELRVGADDADDLARATAGLAALGVPSERNGTSLSTSEPVTGTRVVLDVAPRTRQGAIPATPYNGPGRLRPHGARAPGVAAPEPRCARASSATPCVGSTDYAATTALLHRRARVQDQRLHQGATARSCAAPPTTTTCWCWRAPVNFLHHTSWQVDDVDDVGRGAQAMLEGNPERHVWGLGRHHAGSNFFWYLKDPAGNFSEYYSDMDCIIDDQLWTPEISRARRACSTGARRRRRPSCIPTTSPP